jgi:hypothetical protein
LTSAWSRFYDDGTIESLPKLSERLSAATPWGDENHAQKTGSSCCRRGGGNGDHGRRV